MRDKECRAGVGAKIEIGAQPASEREVKNTIRCLLPLPITRASLRSKEMRGAFAKLRNVSGRPPKWRRFECTSVMPGNIAEFRFAGVDGRGRELIREPGYGAPAVGIEDPDSGSEDYTFDIFWRTGDARPIQVLPPQPHLDAYHLDRDERFRGTDARALFFQRIREDLDHVSSGPYPFTPDRVRLDRTKLELGELQQKLARGYYDEQELDGVIGAMDVVLRANRLANRDRDILADGIRRLRDFRVRHDQYGARDIEGPYHNEREQRLR